MKKALVLTAIAVFAIAAMASAATATKTFAPGVYLIGVPQVPFDPAPDKVFGSADVIDMKLTRFDPASGYVDYSQWTWDQQGGYGNILLGDGAWFQPSDTVTVSYSAVDDGVPTNPLDPSTMTDMWISLPKTGPTLIGLPFNHSVMLKDCKITDGTQTLSFADAASNNMVEAMVTGFSADGYFDIGTDDWQPYQTMEPWNGYIVKSLQDNLALIIPANPPTN